MLQANRSGRSHRNPNYQTLLAFMPRQVLLAEKNAKTPTTMMEHCSSKTVKTLNPDQKARLLHSVLRYLEANGFSRALKRLLSEAQIENDHWKSCTLNLEDIYGKDLETCSHAEMKFDTYKEQEVISDGISNKHEDIHCSVLKKKNKSNYEVDDNAAANQPGIGDEVVDPAKNSMEILATDLLTDANVELKKKKQRKKVSDSVHPTEQVSIQVLKEPIADIVCELQMDESIKKQKDKEKKKSKSLSESLQGNVEQIHLDSLPVEIIEKDEHLKASLGDGKDGSEVEVKSRDKKKKTKPRTYSLGDDVEHCELENKKGLSSDSMPVATENESKDSASPKGNNKTDCVTDAKSKDKKKKKKQQQSMDSLVENIEQYKSSLENLHGVLMEEKKGKSKEKKRKREGSVSETLSDGVPSKEDSMKSELKIESFQTSDKPLDKEKRSSKKRKTLASDENEGELVDRLISEKSKSRKTEPLKEANNTNTGHNENTGKESKGEDCRVDQSEFRNMLAKQPTVYTNGDLDKNGDKSAAQKTSRKQHEGSAEPKTVNAFQRVKLDEVQFADQRLQDNSYWAKGGAEVGYGAKAQEILGQVRGRDFRHEKTKKKRGSYKGGQIDLQTHSVKFNYSDDE